MKLDSTQLTRIDLDVSRRYLPAPAAPAISLAHSERISISSEGLDASHDQAPPARAEVRSYRAVMFRGKGRLSASDAQDTEPAPRAPAVVRTLNPRAAVAAYRETMLAAAA